MNTPVDLETFNALPAEQAGEYLMACCSAERWIHNVTSGRIARAARTRSKSATFRFWARAASR